MRLAPAVCSLSLLAAACASSTNASTTGTTGSHHESTGTTGGAPLGAVCATGAHWVGDVCAVDSCATGSDGLTCTLAAGGFATCVGGLCQVPNLETVLSCGVYGARCPLSTACVGAVCQDAGLDVPNCASAHCPAGTTCSTAYGASFVFCAVTSCAPGDQDMPCGTGRSLCCADACADVGSDVVNCGTCGHACGSGEACVFGVCRPNVACDGMNANAGCQLASGEVGQCCGSQCLDTSDDAANCGGCGQTCAGSGTSCVAGLCQVDCAGSCPSGASCLSGSSCSSTTCSAAAEGFRCADADGTPGVCCGSACVDETSDALDCGTCGHACATGMACVVGACQTAPTCAAAGEGAACLLSGGERGQCCSGTCGVVYDDDNCGACGASCQTGTHCGPIAGAGFQCLASATAVATCPADGGKDKCPAGAACIDGLCYASACSALSDMDACSQDGLSIGVCCQGECHSLNENQNCGGCGIGCPEADSCVGGICAGPAGADFCTPATICDPAFFCGGEHCQLADCVGLGNGVNCAFGNFDADSQSSGAGICCAETCVDPSQDPANCGGCGITCPAATACGRAEGRSVCLATGPGACTVDGCAAGETCTPFGCVDSLCGASNAACLAETGSLGTCCGVACADLTQDAQNCGTCGAVCAAGQTCVGGVCSGQVQGCGAGQFGQFCNIANGSSYLCCTSGCVDTSGDDANCGSCSHACDAGHCESGLCH